MGLKTETRSIDGIEITTTQLPALRAFALMTRLGKVIAPALSKVQGVALDSDVADLGPALAALFTNLDGAEAQSLACEILASSSATVDGKVLPLGRSEMIDLAFSGRLGAMLGALRFAVEVNYADFFAGALRGLPAVAPKVASESI